MSDDATATGPETLAGYRDKLVRRKQDWARDGRLLQGANDAQRAARRLPPGQREVRREPERSRR